LTARAYGSSLGAEENAMTTTAKFTLRFHNAKTHEVLGLVAERYGMSKNQLAEEMLERELQAAALALELDLSETLDLLRNYNRGERLDEAIEEIAEAEAYAEDPLKARMVEGEEAYDAHGVMAAFTS
jgi:hypothetical protein